MRRHKFVVAATFITAASLMLGGCGSSSAEWLAPAGLASQSPQDSASATPTPPANAPASLSEADRTLSVEGVGPFRIGVSTIGSLNQADLVTLVAPYWPEFCPGIHSAYGAGDWTGLVTLYFRDETPDPGPMPTAGPAESPPDAVLVAVETQHSDIITFSKAHVGMTGAQIKQIYKNRVQESQGYGDITIYTVQVDAEHALVMLTDSGTDVIARMFAQRGDQPPLIPRDGPAC